jgi:hypothetical protein
MILLIPPEGEGGRVPAGWGSSVANDIARKLRKLMTRQEVKLWVELRGLRAVVTIFAVNRRSRPISLTLSADARGS